MKTIYINQQKPKKKSFIVWIIAVLIVLALAAKFFISPFLERFINKSGSDEKGYSFRIYDLDLKIFKGEASVKKVVVYNHRNDHSFLDAKDLLVDFDPLKIFSSNKVFSLKADLVNVTISKDFVDEVKRVRNEDKETPSDVYIEKLTADVKKMNVRLLQEDKGRTLMTLNNLHTTIKDFGLGKADKVTLVHLTSAIEGGGKIELQGKTKLEKGNTSWTFNGQMKNITPPIIEKLAGQNFPFELEASNFDAAINAHSSGGEIAGEISPKLKELKIKVDKKDGALKRNLAKVSNYITDKLKDDKEDYTLSLPFTLNENFTLDLEDSWNKFKKK